MEFKSQRLFQMNRDSPAKENLKHVVAVTGCDGAGKSTLSEDLLSGLQPGANVQWLYLGQSSGNIARWITGLPLVGAPVGRYLVAKAKTSQSKNKAAPGIVTIMVIYLLSQWRAHKFRRMLRLNRKGVLVITDRYPQAEVAGFHFDGPGLGAVTAGGWLSKTLAAREQRLYEWMASHVPALVIRLNIDVDTAHSRKPEHRVSVLQDKVAIIPCLDFNGARILDLDGCEPYSQVRAAALDAVGGTFNRTTHADSIKDAGR